MRMRTIHHTKQAIEMADHVSVNEFLSTEISESKGHSLGGSLESIITTTSVNKDLIKGVPGTSSYIKNIHIGGSTPSNVSAPRQQHLIVRGSYNNTNQSSMHGANVNVSTSLKGNISNSQIIGVSSIINSHSHKPHPNTQGVINTAISNDKLGNNNSPSSPSIRFVSNTRPTTKVSTNSLPQSQFTTIARPTRFISSAMSQGVTIRPPQSQGSNPGSLNSSVASAAIHNIATIAGADQKSIRSTLLPNGSAHLQNKPGSVISSQILMKGDSNHSVNTNNNLNVNVKTDIQRPMSNSVIPGVANQSIRSSTAVINPGQQQLLKSVSGAGSNVITLRTHVPSTQQHVIVRPSIATTLANTTSSLQVVNASPHGVPSVLHRTVVTQPVRPTQQPNIAPRQASSSQVSCHIYVIIMGFLFTFCF